MHSTFVLAALSGIAIVNAQNGAPPPPQLLASTKSGVLPVLPTETPFTGVETNEGAIISPGPIKPGFTGPGGTATAQTNLPAATYRADLPSTMFDPLVGTTIQGSVIGVGTPSGVQFSVNFTSLPDQAQYGPFLYHIHGMPVPADGNCTATMGHLDPTDRGELYMCDNTAPQTCQVGDLAGKHGMIMTPNTFTANYVDAYLSTDPSSAGFFGGLSIVIHTMNTTRLTCANFVQVGSSGSNSTSSSMSMSGSPTATASGTGASGTAAAPTSSTSVIPAAANQLSTSFYSLVAAGVAALFFI